MSLRAWVLFLTFSTLVVSAAYAVTPKPAAPRVVTATLSLSPLPYLLFTPWLTEAPASSLDGR